MEAVVAFLFVFRTILRHGNLDLLYFISIIISLWMLIKRRDIFIKIIYMLLPCVLSVILAGCLSQLFSSWFKSIIYLGKIYLNITLMIFTMEFSFKINLKRFLKITVMLLSLLTFIAICFDTEILWRFNDNINGFSRTRLQLLYLEPSLLSMSVSILILLAVYLMISERENNDLVIYQLILWGILYLSAGMNGFICLFIALISMITIKYIKEKKINKKFIGIICGIILVNIIFLLNTNFAMILRLKSIVQGNDSSFYVRFIKPLRIIKDIFIKTNGMGVGLGNLNMSKALMFLNQLGKKNPFANSYMYFLAESGISGVIILIIGNIILIKKSIRRNILLTLPLWIFIFYYQIVGGYFTNPIIWALYGLICADNLFEKNKNDCNKL